MNNIWHNSNEEQPDGKRVVIARSNYGGVWGGRYQKIKPNYRWAYLEDLDPEYVECGNCINDKGCIVCENGEQKQILT